MFLVHCPIPFRICYNVAPSSTLGLKLLNARIEEAPDGGLGDLLAIFRKRAEMRHEIVPDGVL